MIVKKIKSKKCSKPKARQIADLVDYIRQPKGGRGVEKVEHSGSRNLLASRHEGQRLEMIALATESVHSRMPVSHYVFSWRADEQPTAAQVDELVDIFLRELGLEGCQTVYGLHWNTDNYHVHIAVNRMHPVTMKVIDPNNGFDIEAAHKVLALVEHRQGWVTEAHARYAVNESGQVVPRPCRRGHRLTQAARDIECATGEKSAQRVAHERGHKILATAETWAELHARLAEVGLRFERKGSGAIIFVGDIAVKASSVDKAFSLGKLQKRLGEFVAGDYGEGMSAPQPEPVSPVNQKLWRNYQEDCAALAASEKPEEPAELDAALARKKKEQRQEQETLHERFQGYPRCILNIARHFLKRQQRKELRQLRRELSKRKPPRRPRFEDWLREHGFVYQAHRWRYRKALEAFPPEFRGRPTVPPQPTWDPRAAYAAYGRAILQASPNVTPDRFNASIAYQMRKVGFPPKMVEETLFQCAPQAWKNPPDRDWRRYAHRMMAYAFGIEGDTAVVRELAVKASKLPKPEMAETQPRDNGGEQATNSKAEEELDAQRPAHRTRMR
ncbi:MAG: relaxase/mobilization nuclease domain-containing protein [Desulfovibrio sp.]|nr:relaxase/mobilization nuclease domain-containing protein [Desulfovibrio sp.]